jgi:hypothetical protein
LIERRDPCPAGFLSELARGSSSGGLSDTQGHQQPLCTLTDGEEKIFLPVDLFFFRKAKYALKINKIYAILNLCVILFFSAFCGSEWSA